MSCSELRPTTLVCVERSTAPEPTAPSSPRPRNEIRTDARRGDAPRGDARRDKTPTGDEAAVTGGRVKWLIVGVWTLTVIIAACLAADAAEVWPRAMQSSESQVD